MNTNDGSPAFPVFVTVKDDFFSTDAKGMTLRQWFAGQALAGIMANPANIGTHKDDVKLAYEVADDALAQREKT